LRVRSAPALSRITLLLGRSRLLNHLPLDSRLWLSSEVHFILIDSRLELSYSASWSVIRLGQLSVRHAFNMNRKCSKNRSLIDTDRDRSTPKTSMPYCFTIVIPPSLLSSYTRFFSMIANIANCATCIFL
jgi:hypothetical protein